MNNFEKECFEFGEKQKCLEILKKRIFKEKQDKFKKTFINTLPILGAIFLIISLFYLMIWCYDEPSNTHTHRIEKQHDNPNTIARKCRNPNCRRHN